MSAEHDRLLRRIAHGRGDVGQERGPILYAGLVMVGSLPLEGACLAGSPDAVHREMEKLGHPLHAYVVVPFRLGEF